MFSEVKSIFRNSDYVIANFENVCASSRNDYKNEYLLYNYPDQIVKDMKSSGIDFVITTNNHYVDQEIDGLKRTIKVLDSNSVEHTGTYTDQKRRDACKIVLINDIKIAILSYTYGTNESNTGVILNQDTANRYLDQIEKDIIKAKILSDVVVACIHIGGQFNEEPGDYSKFIVDFLYKGALILLLVTIHM